MTRIFLSPSASPTRPDAACSALDRHSERLSVTARCARRFAGRHNLAPRLSTARRGRLGDRASVASELARVISGMERAQVTLSGFCRTITRLDISPSPRDGRVGSRSRLKRRNIRGHNGKSGRSCGRTTVCKAHPAVSSSEAYKRGSMRGDVTTVPIPASSNKR